ncbi:MAG: nucleotidyltransferase family protein [Rhodothermales bacterium]|nr:nucleotidyltransferase family protein [Rhodothermales bacterium]
METLETPIRIVTHPRGAAGNAHPPALELLLRAVRPASDAGNEAAIDALLASGRVDWDRLVALARGHGMIPLLYRALRDRTGPAAPADTLAAIQQDFHRMSMLIHVQIIALRRVLGHLDARGIPAIVLKGLPLGRLAYGNPIWRKPGDIDLLIHPEHYQEVRLALAEMDYQPDLTGDAAARELDWKKQMTFRGAPCDVDVHLGLEQASFLRIAYAAGADDDAIRARCRTVTIGGLDVRTLGPEDLVAFLCIHSAKHAWSHLFMIADLAAFVANNAIDWPVVAERTAALKADRYVAISLLLAHRLCGTELPAHWADADRTLGALADRIERRLFADTGPTRPIAFHLLQARILAGALEKGRYFVNVCLEHVRRKRRAHA